MCIVVVTILKLLFDSFFRAHFCLGTFFQKCGDALKCSIMTIFRVLFCYSILWYLQEMDSDTELQQQVDSWIRRSWVSHMCISINCINNWENYNVPLNGILSLGFIFQLSLKQRQLCATFGITSSKYWNRTTSFWAPLLQNTQRFTESPQPVLCSGVNVNKYCTFISCMLQFYCNFRLKSSDNILLM